MGTNNSSETIGEERSESAVPIKKLRGQGERSSRVKKLIIGLILAMLLVPVACGGPSPTAPAPIPSPGIELPPPEPAPVPEPEPTPMPEPAPEPEPVQEPTPAVFTIHDLSISPTKIDSGEEITITVSVSNIGDEAGECLVHFAVDDEPLHLAHFSLDGGSSEKMELPCKVSRGGGTYTVFVNGLVDIATFDVSRLSGTFTVTEKADCTCYSYTLKRYIPCEQATAICRDGTCSISKSRSGTCSHHGGVARWLK